MSEASTDSADRRRSTDGIGKAVLVSLGRVLFGAGFLGLLLVFATSFFAATSFHAELLTHFRMQYVWVGLIMLAGSRWLANRAFTWLTVLLILPHLVQVAPYYYPPHWLNGPSQESALADRPLKVLSFNVYHRNDNYQATIDYLRQTDADIVGLIECETKWAAAIREGLQDVYPYDSSQVLPTWSGNHVFSKMPLQAATDHFEFGRIEDANKLLAVRALWQGRPFVYAAVHPASPDQPEEMKQRNTEFLKIASVAEQTQEPLIVAGDFNCTSGSPFFKQMLQQSGLQDTRRGFGWQGSWPAFASPILIPIDHVLTSRQWETVYRGIGPELGSDHLPVYVELQLRDSK